MGNITRPLGDRSKDNRRQIPTACIKIANAYHIAGRAIDLYPVAHLVRNANQNVDPPIKLVIGVCSANPNTNEINPRETTAVYQSAKSLTEGLKTLTSHIWARTA